MADQTGVNFRDIASGKVARVASGPYDIRAQDPSNGRKPCRALAVASGALTITGLDGIDVDLPDMGGAWQWDLQAIAVVSGDCVVIW